MPKSKQAKQHKKNWSWSLNIDLFICLTIICILYIPTINREWLLYDERIIVDGTYFATPLSLGEIFEIINNFGLNFNVLSSNTIYSSNYLTRTCPLAQIFGMLINFFLKKEAVLYHIFNLVLHLINTVLVFYILKLTFKSTNNLSRLPVILLTLIWATHPALTESILLSINCGATFSYIFFFSLLLDFLLNRDKNTSFIRRLIIPIIFFIPMLINEYIAALPVILFFISTHSAYKTSSLKAAFKKAFQETAPYLIGLLCYVLYFFFTTNYQASHLAAENEFVVFLERVFWLSPQIFFHLLKVTFLPLKLSIDQTVFVSLGKTLFDPYSLFCIIFLVCWLFIPLAFYILKRKLENLCFTTWTFFLALLPFLHILMPSYTLAADRYLYTSIMFLVLGAGKTLSNLTKTKQLQLTISTVLSVILILLFTRALYRTFDWKDNYSFINSSYKMSSNPLFKAMRLGMLGKAMAVFEGEKKEEIKNYFFQTLDLLREARDNLTKERIKFQEKLPLVIKVYGLDYDSLLSKVAFLEASSRCLELNEGYKIGLELLKPYVKIMGKTEPRVSELYAHLLISDKKYGLAKKILLKANETYPNTPFTLLRLIDYFIKYENNKEKAEKYLMQALKFHPYDKAVLLKAIEFYQLINSPSLTAKYAYLYGLRAQSKLAYNQALSIFLDLGDLSNAKKTVNKLLKIDSQDPQTLYLVSNYYYKVNDLQKALEFLLRAYNTISSSDTKLAFSITYALSRLYIHLGNKDEAIRFSQDALRFARTNSDSLHQLARLYKSLNLTEYFNYCIKEIFNLQNNTG
ncbi:MAG: hypothetical protein HYY52_01530 [Candidatus Melainabacteria bacterium]|nr:hypothetical protein [Candidatus Melainabacteria bacterium]